MLWTWLYQGYNNHHTPGTNPQSSSYCSSSSQLWLLFASLLIVNVVVVLVALLFILFYEDINIVRKSAYVRRNCICSLSSRISKKWTEKNFRIAHHSHFHSFKETPSNHKAINQQQRHKTPTTTNRARES